MVVNKKPVKKRGVNTFENRNANRLYCFLLRILPPNQQNPVLLLNMYQKRSTHNWRWTLTSLLTSGGISFPIFICCRHLSMLTLLVEVKTLAVEKCFYFLQRVWFCLKNQISQDVETNILSRINCWYFWTWLVKVNTNSESTSLFILFLQSALTFCMLWFFLFISASHACYLHICISHVIISVCRGSLWCSVWWSSSNWDAE